jgi:hypothetical protein
MDGRKSLLAFICHLFSRVFLVGIIVATIQSSCQGAANEDTAAQVEAAVTAIQHNYSQWRAIRASLERIVVNPGLSKKKVETSRLSGGRTITITREPRVATLEKIVLRGNDLRYEVFNEMEDKPKQIETRLDGKVTDYHAIQGHEQMAFVTRPDETPDTEAIDPRDIGVAGGKLSLVQVLRDYTTVEAKWVRIGDGTQRFQVRKDSPKGQRMVFLLDPAKNMLPSLLGYLAADGNFSWATHIDYQDVNVGAGWFPKKAVSKAFPVGQGKDFDRDSPHQIETIEVTELVLDGPVDDREFQQSLPQGVVVYDNFQPKRYTVGEKPQVPSQKWSFYRILAWVSVGLAVLVGLAACVLYYFKSRQSGKHLKES